MQGRSIYDIYGKDMIKTGQVIVQEFQEEMPKKIACLTSHSPKHLMEMNLLLNPNITEQERQRLLRTIDKNNNRRVLTNIQEEGTTDTTQTTGTRGDKEEELRTVQPVLGKGLEEQYDNTYHKIWSISELEAE